MNDMKGVALRLTCPSCPCQFEGTVDGYPAYYRSRWGEWEFDIVKTGTDPILPKPENILYHGEGYGGEFDTDAWGIIKQCVAEFRKKQERRGE